MKFRLLLSVLAITALSSCSGVKDGDYELTIVSTGDGHGNWFSLPCSPDMTVRGSLMAQSKAINELRAEKGAENVILIDVGDNLSGGNANFYYTHVDTLVEHPFPRMAAYMKYDAVVAGHADFEAGHRVYDRAAAGFRQNGIPFLAGNALDETSGKPYFQTYTVVKRGGLKVAVLGYTNAGNASLTDSSCFSGIHFVSLLPMVQEDVDRVRDKERPQAVIVAAHTGMGKGDGQKLDRQGLDLFHSLRGVDVLIAGHDHGCKVMTADSIIVIDGGRGAQNMGVVDVTLSVKDGTVINKKLTGNVVNVNRDSVNTDMEEAFRQEFEKVRDFTCSTVGEVSRPMISREFYWGQCDYLNFLHTLALTYVPVDISLTATLLIDGTVEAGDVEYKDIRKIYPYENRLVVLSLSGLEVKNYLEASYDAWICNGKDNGHILKMKLGKDFKTGKMEWKLAKSPANFDSGAGLNYTIDVTRPYGSRISITGMADGSAFDTEKMYRVAITSYRASGSGGLLQAAGLDSAEKIESRILYRGPEFRTILYEYFRKNGRIDPSVIGDTSVVGRWSFVPESVPAAIKADIEVIFGE